MDENPGPFPSDMTTTDLVGSWPLKDGYLIENNRWGGEYHQSVCFRTGSVGGTPLCGWYFDCPAVDGEDGVKGFPEVVYGYKPWAQESTTPELPRHVDNLPQFVADLAAHWQVENGKFNLSFDMWVTAGGKPNPANRVAEIMVWLYREGGADPAGVPTGRPFVDDVGRQWTVWHQPAHGYGWDEPFAYICFCPSASQHKPTGDCNTKIELGQFVRETAERGYVPTDSYLSSIELGTEVWYGRGYMILDRFSITVV
jgi:hypothetical protein